MYFLHRSDIIAWIKTLIVMYYRIVIHSITPPNIAVYNNYIFSDKYHYSIKKKIVNSFNGQLTYWSFVLDCLNKV